MAKMTRFQFTAGLIAAALVFRQEGDEEDDKARLRALATDGEEAVQEDYDEEVLWERFQDFVGNRGIPDENTPGINPDIFCFAGLKEGEPSFTLRGQDILASMLVRHWIALYEGLAPDASNDKVNEADRIAERMEMYGKQRWAD